MAKMRELVAALNQDELTWGLVVGWVAGLGLGLWGFGVSLATSLLWAIGGAPRSVGGRKAWRRYGVPVVIVSAYLLDTRNPVVLWTLPMMIAVLSMGYGIPDDVQPYDEGSMLGRVYYRMLGDNQKYAHVATRVTIAMLLTGVCVPLWLG